MLPCAILAGGLATRLRPVTETIPKALLPINGEPFLHHQFALLRSRGIVEVVLCVGYLGGMIEASLGDGARYGMKVRYSLDGNKLLGTGGAIRQALPLLGDSFFVLYGDSYLECDYAAVERTFLQSGKRGLMTVYRNEGSFDSSNIEFEGGRILRYDKKIRTPAMRHIDYGLGAFHRSVFETYGSEEVVDLAAIYQELLAGGDLAAFEVNERFYEIGSHQGIQDLEQHLASI